MKTTCPSCGATVAINASGQGAAKPYPAPACSPVTIEKMIGGGDSWYYALQDGKVLGAAHEDDVEAMQRLRDIQKANDRMTATQAARVLARRAAAAPSPARQAASRANGRKGGRPRRCPTTGAEGAK